MEQAVRDGLIKVNPARVSGWQRQYQQVEDELNDPRALACPTGRLLAVGNDPDARIFFGPRGGRISTPVLRKIAGHGSLTTTQRYLHPDADQITAAGAALSAHLMVLRAPRSLPVTAVTAI
ncbi:hypothetical protein [Streptomyces sp. AB3(2024)]|uniref:hypothetical protein n=1 Tax=Streptomyces sp. AB3(2024) TaxID=3317321 RepID=UPI0035A2F4AE